MAKSISFAVFCSLAVLMVEVQCGDKSKDDIQKQLDFLLRKMNLLENENKEMKERIHSMEDSIKACQNSEDNRDVSIGFNAFLGSDQNVPSGGNVIFGNVSLNTGTYDLETGEFTCPVAGIYFFAFNLHARADDDWTAQIQIARQDDTIEGLSSTCWIGAHTFSSGTASSTYCDANEKVFVRNTWPSDRWARSKFDEGHQDGVFQSSFTGFLVNQQF